MGLRFSLSAASDTAQKPRNVAPATFVARGTFIYCNCIRAAAARAGVLPNDGFVYRLVIEGVRHTDRDRLLARRWPLENEVIFFLWRVR